MIRPSSKVVVKVLAVMQKHGTLAYSIVAFLSPLFTSPRPGV